MAGGLLDVDVLAGVARQDGGRGVPVVGGGDDDRVDGLVVENFAQVLRLLRRIALHLVHVVVRLAHAALVHVAHPGHLHAGEIDERAEQVRPLAAGADDPQHDFLVRAGRPGPGGAGPGRRRGAGDCE